MTSVGSRGRVLLIALDAADPSVVEQGISDGRLPNLASLRRAGGYTRLGSSADWLAGSIWPTLHAGAHPGVHGVYHYLQWHQTQMSYLRPTEEWLPHGVFWREAAACGPRVIAVDVPSVYEPRPFNGIHINGWSNADLFAAPTSYPADVLPWAEREFGTVQLGSERSSTRPATLRRLRDQLVHATERTAALAQSLMKRESWDLFLVNLTATHRGGHKLWGRDDLHDVYAACDAAVGRLLEQTDAATVLVFSLHGMGANTSRVNVLPQILARIQANGRSGAQQQASVVQRARNLVPAEWRNAVKGMLPRSARDRLTVYWRTRDVDVRSAPVFSMVADLQGYVRINLRGRETEGLVDPGAEYDRICDLIEEGLRTFVDADTGEPIVADVARGRRLYGDAPMRDVLPDLIVQWTSTPSREHRRITSPQSGSIDWPTPGDAPDGRPGNHRGEGFVFAVGSGIRAGSVIPRGHIVDIAPTVYELLGLEPRPEWRGVPLELSNAIAAEHR